MVMEVEKDIWSKVGKITKKKKKCYRNIFCSRNFQAQSNASIKLFHENFSAFGTQI